MEIITDLSRVIVLIVPCSKTFESSVERKGGFLKLVIPEGMIQFFKMDIHF